MTTLQGKFVWFELVTRDAKKAQAFFGEVLGWKVTPMSMGDETYEMITAGDTPIGGYTKLTGKGAPHFTSYVSIADVDRGIAEVQAAGGSLLAPAFDVPTVGRMAQVADPTGASFWLFRSEKGDEEGPTGPGTFHWNELATSDPARALGFYQRVLGYRDQPMDMGPIGTYHVLTTGELPRAGIFQAPTGAPSAWLPYVHVERCDATLERATRLGAKVVTAPYDIAEVGRSATFVEPGGAALAIITPVPKP